MQYKAAENAQKVQDESKVIKELVNAVSSNHLFHSEFIFEKLNSFLTYLDKNKEDVDSNERRALKKVISDACEYVSLFFMFTWKFLGSNIFTRTSI